MQKKEKRKCHNSLNKGRRQQGFCTLAVNIFEIFGVCIVKGIWRAVLVQAFFLFPSFIYFFWVFVCFIPLIGILDCVWFIGK